MRRRASGRQHGKRADQAKLHCNECSAAVACSRYALGILANCITSRKASFTARSSGNALATSGASKTRFVPALYCAAYLPRTACSSNSVRSYSSLSSSAYSAICSGFLILSSLRQFQRTRTNNPNNDKASLQARTTISPHLLILAYSSGSKAPNPTNPKLRTKALQIDRRHLGYH